MSEIKTQGKSGRTKGENNIASACAAAPLRLVGSLALGIFLLSVLLVLLALGTFIESEYGSEVAKFVIYANSWFHAIIGLFALNLVVSILLRFPWGWYHIPFFTVHAGILVLLFGCYLTWKHGEEAQITLPEGTIGNVAIKPERKQLEFKYVVHAAADVPKPLYCPLETGPFSWQDYQYENWIKDDRRYKTLLWYAMQSGHRDIGELPTGDPSLQVEVLDYYAHSALESVPPFDVSVLWKNKTVQTVTEVGDLKEVPRNWEQVRLDLRQRHGVPGLSDVRGVNAAMSQGERVSYSLALTQDEFVAFQKSRPKGGDHAGLWGELTLYYRGSLYSVNVDQLLNLTGNSRFPVEGSDLQIGDVRFNNRGPILRLSVFTPSGESEAMTLLPDNPEWNVQARRLGVFGLYWVDPQRIMQQSVNHADNPMLQRMALPRLDFMQGPDKKLYYRFWSEQSIVADGIVPDRERQKKPLFKVAEQTPDEAEIVIDRFVPQDVPGSRIVLIPANRNRQNERRVKLRIVFDGKEDIFWIRAVTPTVVPLPPEQDQIRYIYGNGRTLCVQLSFETIDLGFGILLKQFEKRTEPGTRMPSHFSSLVNYVDPIDPNNTETAFSRNLKNYRVLPEGENVLISMNRPGFFRGKGRGYRIYQSSYLGPFYPDQPQFHELYDGNVFPWETRPRESIAMSTLSVNADPGRGGKYFGSFLIVLGSALFVWRKRR
jgi:hypothetical protein